MDAWIAFENPCVIANMTSAPLGDVMMMSHCCHLVKAHFSPLERSESGGVRRSREGGLAYWKLATGYWLLATGYWLLATGYWKLATGYWKLATGYWLLETGHWLL